MAAPPTQRPAPFSALRQLLIRPHEDTRLAILVWGALALACIVAGILTADDATRSEAYFDVRHWLSVWRTGANVYELKLAVDYPPHALVYLSPLLWFPEHYGEVWFAIVNSVICVGAAWFLVSLTSGYAGVALSRAERLAYVLMLIAWSPTRVCIWNGQTTPLVILCCCVSLCLATRYPIAAALALAVGMSKPHIAIGFVLFAAFLRLWRLIAISAATAVSTAVLYAVTVSRSPVVVLREYLNTLLDVYGGPQFLRGEVDIRPFFVDSISDYSTGETLFLATACGLAVTLIALIWRARHNPHAAVWVLCSSLMWAIAVFPFRRYGLLLIAPTILLLLWRPGASARTLTLAGLVIFLIVADLPFLIRHAMIDYGSPRTAYFAPLTHYVNRVVIVGCLAMSYAWLARAGRPATT